MPRARLSSSTTRVASSQQPPRRIAICPGRLITPPHPPWSIPRATQRYSTDNGVSPPFAGVSRAQCGGCARSAWVRVALAAQNGRLRGGRGGREPPLPSGLPVARRVGGPANSHPSPAQHRFAAILCMRKKPSSLHARTTWNRARPFTPHLPAHPGRCGGQGAGRRDGAGLLALPERPKRRCTNRYGCAPPLRTPCSGGRDTPHVEFLNALQTGLVRIDPLQV